MIIFSPVILRYVLKICILLTSYLCVCAIWRVLTNGNLNEVVNLCSDSSNSLNASRFTQSVIYWRLILRLFGEKTH